MAINWAAEVFDELTVGSTDDIGRAKWEGRATALRAAAELIRQGKAIAEALNEIVSCEPIDADPIHKRIKYVEVQIDRVDLERYQKLLADFLPEPEPLAREVERG